MDMKGITRDMIKKGRWLLTLLLSLQAGSCTEQLDWELEYQEEELIVVEGKITDEPGPHQVKLTFPLFELNGIPEPVTGALVEINDARVIHTLTETPRGSGIYLTDPGFAGEAGKGYQLRIRYRGARFTGISFMQEVLPFQFMRPYPVQDDPLLYEVYINDERGPAIVRLELDWSHLPGYDTLPAAETHALIYHYTLGGVDVNRIFPPEREHVRFPPGTIVFREKESVSREYEQFLRSMLSETDWRGGVFDVLPGNARSNMSNGAIGYFTAGAVIRDTVVIK
jgi:hypothetical protein